MATHNGLTRWQDFLRVDENMSLPENHFSKLYPRAIDEVWYKRAVEQHYINEDSFVFSVPLEDKGANNSTLVTASRAVFIGKLIIGIQTVIKVEEEYFLSISKC